MVRVRALQIVKSMLDEIKTVGLTSHRDNLSWIRSFAVSIRRDDG